jgi:hypothetical protein
MNGLNEMVPAGEYNMAGLNSPLFALAGECIFCFLLGVDNLALRLAGILSALSPASLTLFFMALMGP